MFGHSAACFRLVTPVRYTGVGSPSASQVNTCDSGLLTCGPAESFCPWALKEVVRMGRLFVLVYGVVVYVMFLAVFCYAALFVSGINVLQTIDHRALKPLETPATTAIVINVLLLSLFAVQHTIMARPVFKSWWTRTVPEPIERSTFVLATNLVLILLYWQWRPLPVTVWELTNPTAVAALWGICAIGWLVVLISTFMIDHFDLFGLKQTIIYFLGRPCRSPDFKVVGFYKYVRHPLLLGFIIAFWAAPTMTVGHLLYAVITTVYMLLAIQIEEHDLLAAHGEDYADYRRRVSMIVPLPGRRSAE